MKAFLELISVLILVAAGVAFIAGSLNQLFGWDLALRIGGSSIPLPDDFVGVIFGVILLGLLSGVFFLLADLKRPLRFIGKHRVASFGVLAGAIALLVIGPPLLMPNLFLELAVQGGNSTKAQALLEKRDYPADVLSELTYWSLKNEDYSLTKMLLSEGATLDYRRGEFESTLLHDAVTFFAPSATPFLLDAGIDPNAEDSLGRTALHVLMAYRSLNFAAENESDVLALVQSLVAAGADATHSDQNGDTPITLAEQKNYATIIQFFQSS